MTQDSLEALSSTHKGVAKIQAEKNRLLQKIGDAKATGNGAKLIRCQKDAYYSPFLRYEAYKAAVRKHSNVILSPADFLEMADSLLSGAAALDWQREWTYPRPVFDRTKPDGGVRQISTTGSLEDSARETLIRWILEAEWCGRLDPCSYGTKGNGVQQALKAVADYIFQHPMFFVRLDIKACFDTVNHDYLFARLKKELTTFNFDRLKPFLLVEFTDGQTIWDADNGIAQGSSLSALALEVVVKDMGEYITQGFSEDELFFVRYVDDLLLMSPDAEVLQVAKDRLERYLANTGLALNDQKTASGTTLAYQMRAYNLKRDGFYHVPDEPGFTFLGFRVSQYPNPDNTAYETYLDLQIPEGRLEEKRREEKKWGKEGEYENGIKQHVGSVKKVVDGKAWVSSYVHYNSDIPLELLEEFGGLIDGQEPIYTSWH
jgi:retron-type reverse transcriptase